MSMLGGVLAGVTVIGWKKTQYTAEFWKELTSRCAKEILGREVALKVTFKSLKEGYGKSYHRPDRFSRYEVELDPLWSDESNAATVAHEVAHVRQYVSGMDLSDRAALERDAVSYEHVGTRIFQQMKAAGWKPRFSHPTPSQLLDKKVAAQLTAEELALLDMPVAQMTGAQMKQAMALMEKMKES